MNRVEYVKDNVDVVELILSPEEITEQCKLQKKMEKITEEVFNVKPAILKTLKFIESIGNYAIEWIYEYINKYGDSEIVCQYTNFDMKDASLRYNLFEFGYETMPDFGNPEVISKFIGKKVKIYIESYPNNRKSGRLRSLDE